MPQERIRPEDEGSRISELRLDPEETQIGNDGNNASEIQSLREERNTYVRHWSQIKAELPEDFNRHHIKFVRGYFRAQLRIARGQKTKARRIFDGLVNKAGYEEFEAENKPILAAIDYAVRGTTNWEDELKRKIEPAFKIK